MTSSLEKAKGYGPSVPQYGYTLSGYFSMRLDRHDGKAQRNDYRLLTKAVSADAAVFRPVLTYLPNTKTVSFQFSRIASGTFCAEVVRMMNEYARRQGCYLDLLRYTVDREDG